jgi:hypothetical protein
MKPDPKFLGMNKRFWASVRSASEFVGYSTRGRSSVLSPRFSEIENAFINIGIDKRVIADAASEVGETVKQVSLYFEYRAQILNDYVEPRLMDADRAKKVFEDLKNKLSPTCPLPMNKQTGDKKAPAYLTGIINMLIEANSGGMLCDYDPRGLTSFIKEGMPIRTLARRVDGAFPLITNPVALWEIKEYYYTTTFGSRVADGIYESLLDGMEIEELRDNEGIDVLHYLMVDSHFTWWDCGRSYLCRIIDMLHMGYIDEALFGYEVVERLPGLVAMWVKLEKEKTGE